MNICGRRRRRRNVGSLSLALSTKVEGSTKTHQFIWSLITPYVRMLDFDWLRTSVFFLHILTFFLISKEFAFFSPMSVNLPKIPWYLPFWIFHFYPRPSKLFPAKIIQNLSHFLLIIKAIRYSFDPILKFCCQFTYRLFFAWLNQTE